MKATKFIKDHGVKRAREVVKNHPALNATHYRARDNKYSASFKPSIEIVYVADLKRLVESVDRVNQRGGYLAAKELLSFSIVHQETFGKNAVVDEIISSLKGEIADYESIYGEE
ncbi:hypothetical protein [Acinetobacter oleivorans]|uniref:hypothetical protein n=1 Tax=Acinetobacter oleivorans TaxID=1148157 RepID=UPI001230ABB9|nr:hypothetical protein [Acinetobacter oleivorans]